MNDKQSLDELLEEIGHFMRQWGETISVRPTRPIDTLSDQPLAGMEALSAALIKEEVPKIAYEQIMAFANCGFLGEKFRNYNP